VPIARLLRFLDQAGMRFIRKTSPKRLMYRSAVAGETSASLPTVACYDCGWAQAVNEDREAAHSA
jgi:hypothetical protein